MRIFEFASAAQGLKRHVCIHIGEFHASRNPTVISTLLGSCVAVCLFDPVLRIGGMNHILMPGRADLKHFDTSARYGINAMELLINRIMNLGGSRLRLAAKIFGGAKTLSVISEEYSMGRKNIEFVTEFLKNESIPIVNKDLGGNRSRRIWFHTDTHDVFLKRGRSVQYTSIPFIEKRAGERIRRDSRKSGEIILWNFNNR
jgi:chemotaxis protein CheD